MRIGMMLDAYKPHVSGITNFVSLNKRALEAAGHKVFVFTFGDLDYEDDELNVVRSPGVPLSHTGYYFSFRYSRRARRKLQTMDIVHVHHPFLSGRLALRYCRPYNIPVVFTNHTRYDLYAQSYLPIVPEEVGTAFLQTYIPWFCREVDLVIAPSAGLLDVLRDMGVECQMEVIPNGVDLGPLRTPARPIPRADLGFGPEDVVLIYVGRLGPEKNLTFLVRAFAGTRAAYPEAKLLLVGDGPERENLEAQVASSGLEGGVRFAGMVAYADLPGYLAAADIFATASVTEVHPLSVIEALAVGLPVIGIRSPGIEDTVVDGENGFLSSNDLAVFTAKLSRLVAEGDSRQRMSQRARETAEQYAIERTSARLEGCYQRLVGDKPRRRETTLQLRWQRLVDRFT
jgi:1,2-diacylglycerol 3-alpha-glucosyltransferase